MAHIVTRTGIGKPSPASPLWLDVGGAVNFDSTLSVTGASSFLSLVSIRLSTNAPSLETRITGDSEPLFSVLRDGQLSWGPGGASPTDLTLYRSSANLLRTSGSFTVDNDLLVSGSGIVTGDFTINGNTFLGNASSDTVTFVARIDSILEPTIDDTYDLGSVGRSWRNLYLSGSAIMGSSSADTTTFNSLIASNVTPSIDDSFSLGTLLNRWSNLFLGSLLRVDGNAVLGDSASDTLTVNASVNSDFVPFTDATYSLGSLSFRWENLYLSDLLRVDGNSILGDSAADTLTVNASVNSDLVPSATNTYSLGTSSFRWNSLFVNTITASGDLQVDGNTILGDANSDTVTFNARINSDMVPAADNTYDIGTSSLRWKTLHVGPGSVVVHNDNTNTNSITLGFSGSDASLNSDFLSPINIHVGVTDGIFLDTLGRIGINKVSGIAYQLDVSGTGGFSDTINANKATGISVYSESNVVVNGSVEAPAASGVLNVGTTSDTEYVNIGTGPALQTINIGTGPGPTIINIGASGDIINFGGTATYAQTTNTSVLDKTFVLNAGGLNLTGANAGVFVEEAAASLLSVSDALWQSGNIVRYVMANTGNINIGNTVVITGFSNASNNGSFVVSAISVNAYIDVVSGRSNASADETGATAFSTNPFLVGGISINSARDAWELYSPSSSAFVFAFKNSGGNTTLESSASGLIINAPSSTVLPAASGNDLGSSSFRWDLFSASADIDSLTVNTSLISNGNTTLGDSGSDTVTFNAVPSFINKIGSSLIPNSGVLDLGSSLDPWRDLYLSGSADVGGSVDIGVNLTVDVDLLVSGNTTLGDANTDLVSFFARIDSNIVPSTASSFDLGSVALPWNNVYASSLSVPGFTVGSIVFAGLGGTLSENNSYFFWDNSNYRLGIGTNTPDKNLTISNASAAATLKMLDSGSSAGVGVLAGTSSRFQYTDSLLFSAVSAANLASASAGTDAFSVSSAGLLSSLGGFSFNVNSSVAANTYAVSSTDTVIRVDTSSGSITANCAITLPSAATKRILIIKDMGNNCSTTNKNIVLTPASGEFIEFGAADETYIMDADGMSLTLHSDGVSRWYII